MKNVLINGEFKDTISIFDRGLQYGDGLFETMVAINDEIKLWDAHWERLTDGCKRLSIDAPDKQVVENDISLLMKKTNSSSLFIVKLIITRGVGERGYRYSSSQNVTRILSSHTWPDYPEEYVNNGIAVRYCETILSENPKLAGIKHLNRLEQVLARNEWDTDEYQEGLMLTAKGNVIDGTMSNIFAIKDNMLFTPELSVCGVSGVMRKTVISQAKEIGFSVYEKTFTKSELEDADELFITNSIIGIWPIRIIAKTRFTRVGDVTRQLQQAVNLIR
jgi:4-amino-4-deoxychorismate lyase